MGPAGIESKDSSSVSAPSWRPTTFLVLFTVILSCLVALTVSLLFGEVRLRFVLQHQAHGILSTALLGPGTTGHAMPRFGAGGAAAWQHNLPTLLIYRRSMKTGSTSMTNELIRTLSPLQYEPAHAENLDMVKAQLHGNYHRLSPKRYMVVRHNSVTRADVAPWARTLVIDTLRDGYEQVTSFCRYMRKVRSCDVELADCMRNESTLALNRYRWAGRQQEDADTYIDIPLISKFPALCTSLMRQVFPNITLNLQHYRAAGAKCERNNTQLLKIYDENYGQLERQVQNLRFRMLALAGYPTTRDEASVKGVKWDEILEVVEEMELSKYKELQGVSIDRTRNVPDLVLGLKQKLTHWTRDGDGKIVVSVVSKD